MCIASYVKTSTGFIYTFTRDEDPNRAFSNPTWLETNVFAPKDELAGGTWIGYNRHHIYSLQNGGSVKHVRQLPYDKSRGLLLLSILQTDSLNTLKFAIEEHIEPFTINSIDTMNGQLTSIIYDGNNQLDVKSIDKVSFIKLSTTLYSKEHSEMIADRFYQSNLNTEDDIFSFHYDHRVGNYLNPIVKPASSSITQFVAKNGQISFKFQHLLNGEILHSFI